MRNELLERLAMEHPVVQAPMAGGGDTPQLVAAVSNDGGLGCFGAAYSSPQQIAEYAAKVKALTSMPFGVNLFAPPATAPKASEADVARAARRLARFYAELGLEPPKSVPLPAYTFDDQLDACLQTGAVLLSFTFGALTEEQVARAKTKGMLVAGTATTVEEARVLEQRGVDAVVAQGGEAGGHRGTFAGPVESSLIGTIALVPQVCDAVSVPVIASGGIMDGRGVAAALCLGASAVQMGTAFLTCDEAGVPECYKDALLHAREDELVLTKAFSGKFARGVANRLTREMHGDDDVLPFPLQNAMTRPIRNESGKRGDAQMLSLWAGQGVRMATRGSAGDLVRELVSSTAEALARACER
jgi:nitronate monooxygenase